MTGFAKTNHIITKIDIIATLKHYPDKLFGQQLGQPCLLEALTHPTPPPHPPASTLITLTLMKFPVIPKKTSQKPPNLISSYLQNCETKPLDPEIIFVNIMHIHRQTINLCRVSD